MYVWEHRNWPNFSWDGHVIATALGEARRAQGLALGAVRAIGLAAQDALVVDTLTDEIVNTSAIEGVVLDAASVRSSVVRRLGLDGIASQALDRDAEGLAEMLLDATTNYLAPVTPERLWRWHSALFASESGADWIGRWRDDSQGPMQVVSGVYASAPRVHYEAPPAERVPEEMELLCAWINSPPRALDDGIVRSAIAHLWFLTIHPFEDGNGRIARTLADLLLARDEQSPRRYISMSSQINADKAEYYRVVEATQAGSGDISNWLLWYLGAYRIAAERTLHTIELTLKVKSYWEAHAGASVSERQRGVLQRYLAGDFEGFLNAKKYAKLAKVSVDTAERDLKDLLEKGFIERNPGAGRNTSYDTRLGD
ncbi:MAG: Fic family protein [bacterium]|nr:Fic family protein [bacterium]